MKFTFNWLKEHLETELSAQNIVEKLIMLGIEVEDVIDYSKILDKFVVGKIITAEKHPNADKLRVCNVDIGSNKTLQIVCGASNARAGIHVVVSLPGAVIPATQTVLKSGNIRGVESQGMMCSSHELSLDIECKTDGIIELPERVVVGQPAYVALNLNDVIYDVSITPNRGDLFSVRGIARQLASANYGTLKALAVPEIIKTIENPVELKLESKNCKYFSTIAIKNFTGKTPDKIASRLKLCGQKLISCPVDIANYICFDIGQPMHVFDLDKLPNDNDIHIRDAYAGEKIKTLAGNIEILPEGALIASIKDEPISIIGIMGGESTAVSHSTTNLLLESSYFDKIAIAKTGQSLHLCTDARTRFERGIDPKNVNLAQKYFIKILKTVCTEIELSELKSVGELPENKHEISLSYESCHNMLQFDHNDFKNVPQLLTNLGCKILKQTDETITVETPSWRHDLEIEEDLIEEILMLNGFDKIQSMKLPPAEPVSVNTRNDKLIDILIHNGYQECKTFSMIDEKTAELFSPKEDIIHINDALSGEFAVLRTTLVTVHLKAVLNAQNKTVPFLKICECGKQFYHGIENELQAAFKRELPLHNELFKGDKNEHNKIIEENVLIGTIAEIAKPRHWSNPNPISVFDVKADVESLIRNIGIKTRLNQVSSDYYHPGRCGSYVYQKDTCIAQFGEIHPTVLDNLGIKVPVYCFELFLDRIPQINTTIRPVSEVSPYQTVTRDFSFLINKTVNAGAVIETINKLNINEIKNINIFDVYESDNFGKDKKALAFELTLLSDKGTLANDTIQDISNKVIETITKKCNGKLRDS